MLTLFPTFQRLCFFRKRVYFLQIEANIEWHFLTTTKKLFEKNHMSYTASETFLWKLGSFVCIAVSDNHCIFNWHTPNVLVLHTPRLRSHDATWVHILTQNRVGFVFFLSNFPFRLFVDFDTCMIILTYFSWSPQPCFFKILFILGRWALFQINILEMFGAVVGEPCAGALVRCGKTMTYSCTIRNYLWRNFWENHHWRHKWN